MGLRETLALAQSGQAAPPVAAPVQQPKPLTGLQKTLALAKTREEQPISPSEQRTAIEAVNKPVKQELGFWEGLHDSITGASRETEQTRALPEMQEFGSPLGRQFEARAPGEISARDIEHARATPTEKLGNDMSLAGKLLTLTTAEDRMKVIRDHDPGITFRQDENKTWFGVKDGKDVFVVDKPGFSAVDGQEMAVDMAAFIPAAKFGMLFKGLGGLAIKAAGATATEYGLGKVREAAGAEEQGLAKAGIAGGLEVAAEVVPKAIVKGTGLAGKAVGAVLSGAGATKPAKFISDVGRAAVVKMGKIVDETAASMLTKAKKAEEIVPMNILGPQASEVPSDLIMLRVMHEQPATSREMKIIDQIQDKAGKRELYKFLSKLGRSDSSTKGAADFRDAAMASVEKLKTVRRDETKQLYDDLFQDPMDIDINKVIRNIDQRLSKYPSKKSSTRKALEDVRDLIVQKKEGVELYDAQGKLIKTEATGAVPLDILHNARAELGDAIGDATGNKQRELIEIKNSLTEAMTNEATGVPGYGEVSNLYKELSGPIDDLTESIVGKGAKLKDADLEKMSSVIFNPNVKPHQLKALKKVIDAEDPKAFGRLIRAKIESSLAKTRDSITSPRHKKDYTVGDIYKAISSYVGEIDQMRAVLPKESHQNLTYLKEQLRKANLGRGGGSDTASKSELISNLKGKVAGTIVGIGMPMALFGSVGGGLAAGRELSGMVKASNLEKRLSYLYQAALDPKWSKDMARIRKINPDTPAAARAMAQLFNNIEKDGEKE